MFATAIAVITTVGMSEKNFFEIKSVVFYNSKVRWKHTLSLFVHFGRDFVALTISDFVVISIDLSLVQASVDIFVILVSISPGCDWTRSIASPQSSGRQGPSWPRTRLSFSSVHRGRLVLAVPWLSVPALYRRASCDAGSAVNH